MVASTSQQLTFLLRMADTHLIWSHRLAQWCGHGPVLEEDIALANISLDTLGQARLLYQHASGFDCAKRSEDDFAYWRDDRSFYNFTLAELPKGDYAFTVVRNLVLSAYFVELWDAMQQSTDTGLAAIASKAVKESRYHFSHASDWTIRFGDSTPQARLRVEAALFEVWRFTPELFRSDAIDDAAATEGWLPQPLSEIHQRWSHRVQTTLSQATLPAPSPLAFISEGKRGIHSEFLSPLLAEMQSVTRAHPGAQW